MSTGHPWASLMWTGEGLSCPGPVPAPSSLGWLCQQWIACGHPPLRCRHQPSHPAAAARSVPSTQVLDLSASDLEEGTPQPLMLAKFGATTLLTVFVQNNQVGVGGGYGI